MHILSFIFLNYYFTSRIMIKDGNIVKIVRKTPILRTYSGIFNSEWTFSPIHSNSKLLRPFEASFEMTVLCVNKIK